ncbi:hypothetical protein I6N90_04530 [Paenibacillus sp. GSMTC-2017]|nr:hypothetical protein [Paenibacillus sp. GSMTC-2017]
MIFTKGSVYGKAAFLVVQLVSLQVYAFEMSDITATIGNGGLETYVNKYGY